MEERELRNPVPDMRNDDADADETPVGERADGDSSRRQIPLAFLDLVGDRVLARSLGTPRPGTEVPGDRIELDAPLDDDRVDPLAPVDLAHAEEFVRLDLPVADRAAAHRETAWIESRRADSNRGPHHYE